MNKTTINIVWWPEFLKELNSKLELKTSGWIYAKYMRRKLKDKEEKNGLIKSMPGQEIDLDLFYLSLLTFCLGWIPMTLNFFKNLYVYSRRRKLGMNIEIQWDPLLISVPKVFVKVSWFFQWMKLSCCLGCTWKAYSNYRFPEHGRVLLN